METSDEDEKYGANTAVYFCLDRLSVLDGTEQEPLSRPTGVHAVEVGEDSILLAWNEVEGAEKYILLCDNQSAGETEDTCFVFRGLQTLTSYSLSVAAVNASDTSEWASVACQTVDMTAPSKPEDLIAEADIYSITVSWQPATDNVAVKRYTVYVDGDPYRRTTDTSYTIVGLESETVYFIEVEAEDTSGNKSERAGIQVSTLQDATEIRNQKSEVRSQKVLRNGRLVIIQADQEYDYLGNKLSNN